MADIDKMKVKRSALRMTTTKLIKKIADFLGNIDTFSEDNDSKSNILKEFHEQLIEKEKNLNFLNLDIEAYLPLAEVENDCIASEEYSESIVVWKQRIKNKIEFLETKVNNPKKPSSVNSTELSVQNITTVKLPRLNIKTYYGDPTGYLEFMNQFSNAIDNNTNLSKIDKFNYLKSFLGGAAANCIKGFTLSEENYDSAIELLKKRFGNTHTLIQLHMNNLLKIPAVYNSRDLNRLRNFFDKVEVQIRNLESLGIEVNSYCNLLTPIILDRVPRDLVLEFNRKYAEGYTFQNVITFLESEIQSRERAVLVQLKAETFKSGSENLDKSNFKNASGNSKNFKNMSATANYVASTKRHCVFCNNPDHEFCEYKTIEDRKNKLKNENRCFKCFSKNHYSRMCRLQIECKFCKSKFHSYILCEKANDKTSSNEKINEQKNSVVTQCNSSALKSNILLLTCSVIASAGKNSTSKETVRILLDNGSERSWITKSLANRLKLNIIRRERLSVYSFGSIKTSERIYEVAKLKLSNRNNAESSIEIEVLITQTITSASLAVPNIDVQNILQQKGLFLADMCKSDNEIEILIGGDVFWGIICDTKVFKINETLNCVPTMFGLAIQGVQQNCNSSFVGVLSTDCVVARDVQILWDLDILGITDKDELTLTDKRIINRFESNLKFVQGRYETRLLWKFSPVELGNNFCIAKKRFDELQSILRNDEWLAKEYNKIIEDQERVGIVQECIRTKNEYFMPHRPVVRTDKDTTKVRLVFNCSSKIKQSISLNEALECGPNLNANILDIMLNFRKFKIAFNADIEKAFLMISIAENDRKYLKFIWASDNPEGYKIMQMNRLPFGCTTSNFVLNATIKTHIKKYERDRHKTVEMLRNSLYVDDLYFGSESVEEAFQLSSDAVSILKDGGFNLRKLRSNSVKLESLWVDQGLSTSDCLENCQLKLLGLNWNTKDDNLSLDVKSLLSGLSSLKSTKRCVLQTAATIFDPMGFLSPFVVRIKSLMQDIWKIGVDWDEDLPEDLTSRWRKWCSEIEELDSLTVERYFFLNADDKGHSVEIHIFSDASLIAYGAVAYFRYSNEQGKVSTSFIMSKSRVAPLKKLTLPRLELLGVLVAAKLCRYLSCLFKDLFDRIVLWTDSEICLCWIRGSSRDWKQFVANRICVVQDLTSPSMWMFCPGSKNPADKLTRGESLISLKSDSVWWRGPKWLKNPSDEWPKQKKYSSSDAAKVELLKTCVNTVTSSYSPVLNINHFSNLRKLLRVTAWLLRFISKLKKIPIEDDRLNAFELQAAEELWIKIVQREEFQEEIEKLQSSQQISSSSKIYSLSPFLDETGVLRVRGRLSEASLTENEKHPILIPKSKFAELVIFDEHLKVFHSGVSTTLARVRKKFWIPKGRQAVKRVISTCVICKKYSAKPAKQLTGQLPLERVAECPPFTNVGTDFSGAITVKSKLSSCEKVYIVLFTCAVTRAVHIEVVQDMSVKSFIFALRRFLARRGTTKVIFSDNAKTFRSSCEILKSFRKLINHPELKDFIASENIIWKFIPERSPWWGGFWERLMKCIKDPMRKILGRALLTLEELSTILTEIEFILNNRPITYEFNDLNEPSALTPSCFLFPGKNKTNFPRHFVDIFDKSSDQKTLQRRKLFQTRLIKQFWSRWKEQYLLQLRSAHNFIMPFSHQNLKVGDVVLVEGPLKNKLLWDMGVIDKILLGRDGYVRACIVRTSKGCLRRAIQLLYPFEV